MKNKLEKAIEYIKGYCEKHNSCDGCKLNDDRCGGMSMREHKRYHFEGIPGLYEVDPPGVITI